MERVILHSDINNFYASVECMKNPELKQYPIAVCGDVEERHGIVLAKNGKAKFFGVSTGEAIWQAKMKCPNLIIVSPDHEEYAKFSRYAREIYNPPIKSNLLDLTSVGLMLQAAHVYLVAARRWRMKSRKRLNENLVLPLRLAYHSIKYLRN